MERGIHVSERGGDRYNRDSKYRMRERARQRVRVLYHLRSEWSGNLSLLQFLPVDTAEEGVAFDLSLPYPRLATQTPRRVLGQELSIQCVGGCGIRH